MKQLVVMLGFLTALFGFGNAQAYDPFVVYYSDREGFDTLNKYKLLVFDSEKHPPLRPLDDRGKMLLGYVSIMEMRKNHKDFEFIKDKGLLLHTHPNWSESHFIDARKKAWVEYVLMRAVPEVLRAGFNGIFIDTSDSATYLEQQNYVTYKGMSSAVVALIRAIRLHYPHIPIMLNRGFKILDEVRPYITMLLAESIYADYDFEKEIYTIRSKKDYLDTVTMLQKHSLPIYTLDYWKTNDPKTIAAIYDAQRGNGFIPYVADIKLQSIMEEPKLEPKLVETP